MRMKLSVVIPVYNVEKYLRQCVESVQNQGLSLDEYEIVLVNDGSTDSSLAVCEELVSKNRNIVVFSQQNKGQSTARNLGYNISKGKYIYYVDSDDCLSSNFFRFLLEKMESENLDFVGFQYEINSSRDNIDEDAKNFEVLHRGSGFEILADYNFNNGPCWYITSRDLQNDLYFEENRFCEDGIFTAQLLQKVKKGIVYKNRLYHYLPNIESTVNTKNITKQRKLMEDMFYASTAFNKILDKVPNDLKHYHKVYHRLKDRQESYVFFGLVRFLRNQQKYVELKPYLMQLKQSKYPSYPIRVFDGYNNAQNKFLIFLFNNPLLLRLSIFANRTFKILK